MTKMELEKTLASGLVNHIHDLEPYQRESLDPSRLVTFNMKSEALIDSLVRMLAAAVRLGVV